MNLRFLNPTRHGIVDYLAAAGLIVMPFVLNLGANNPLAKWIAVATGLAVILTSLVTTYKYGALHLLPFKGHLAIDTLVAIAFLFIPSLFNFTGIDAYYYWTNSVAVFFVVALTTTAETPKTK